MCDATIQGVIRDTSRYLRDKGWLQHLFVSKEKDDERCCPLAAMGAVLSHLDLKAIGYSLRYKCLQALDQVLWDHYNKDYRDCLHTVERGAVSGTSDQEILERALWLWNDQPGRTVDEVIGLLDLTADLQEYGTRPEVVAFSTVVCPNDASVALAA